jgi:hypothetical protein
MGGRPSANLTNNHICYILLHSVPIHSSKCQVLQYTIVPNQRGSCCKDSSEPHGDLYSRIATVALVGNCHGRCDNGNIWARIVVLQGRISLVGNQLLHKTYLRRTTKVLRQLLNDKTIRQVLGQFATNSDQNLSNDWWCTDELTVVAARSTSVERLGQSRERWTNEHPR